MFVFYFFQIICFPLLLIFAQQQQQLPSRSWPLPSELSLSPTADPSSSPNNNNNNTVILSNLNYHTFNILTSFSDSNMSLIIKDSIFTDQVMWGKAVVTATHFTIKENRFIKFINCSLRMYEGLPSLQLLFEPSSSLEFHNCLIIPNEEQQPKNPQTGAYTGVNEFSRGLQIVVNYTSSNYDIIIKNCTYKFVSQDSKNPFLLEAQTPPTGIYIRMMTGPNNNIKYNHSFRSIQVVENFSTSTTTEFSS